MLRQRDRGLGKPTGRESEACSCTLVRGLKHLWWSLSNKKKVNRMLLAATWGQQLSCSIVTLPNFTTVCSTHLQAKICNGCIELPERSARAALHTALPAAIKSVVLRTPWQELAKYSLLRTLINYRCCASKPMEGYGAIKGLVRNCDGFLGECWLWHGI